MNLKTLTAEIALNTPISAKELTKEVVEGSVTRSLKMINKFKPAIITGKSTTFLSIPEYKARNIRMVEVNQDPISLNSISYGVAVYQEYGTDFATANFVLDHTLATIYEASDSWLEEQFEQLVFNYAMKFVSNRRRSASLSELPFDLKGDEFFNEADTNIKEIQEVLVNSTPQLL